MGRREFPESLNLNPAFVLTLDSEQPTYWLQLRGWRPCSLVVGAPVEAEVGHRPSPVPVLLPVPNFSLLGLLLQPEVVQIQDLLGSEQETLQNQSRHRWQQAVRRWLLGLSHHRRYVWRTTYRRGQANVVNRVLDLVNAAEED